MHSVYSVSSSLNHFESSLRNLFTVLTAAAPVAPALAKEILAIFDTLFNNVYVHIDVYMYIF